MNRKSLIFALGIIICSLIINFENAFAENSYTCTVSKDCNTLYCGSTTISCSGTIKCEIGSSWVRCDGVQVECCIYGGI